MLSRRSPKGGDRHGPRWAGAKRPLGAVLKGCSRNAAATCRHEGRGTTRSGEYKVRSNVRSPTTACNVGSSSSYASSDAICSQAQNRLWAYSPSSALCAPNQTPHRLRYRIFCNLRGMISHLGLQEGHEMPPESHATVQNDQKYAVSGYDQQRLAGASCRIQTFAGHLLRTMIVVLRAATRFHRLAVLSRMASVKILPTWGATLMPSSRRSHG